jgi:cell division protein FtsQ
VTRRRKQSKTADNLRRWFRLVRVWTVRCLLLTVGVAAGIKLFPVVEEKFNPNIEKVSIEGEFQYLDRQEIMENIDIYSSDRLLTVRLVAIKQKLEQLSWVHSVQIARSWPAEIVITVTEQVPIARWNSDYLINQYGETFSREDKVVVNIPQLFSKAGLVDDLMHNFLLFSGILKTRGLMIDVLELDERGSWQVELSNRMSVKLGSDMLSEKIQRFVVLYDHTLRKQAGRVENVDMRYSNGAAVKWLVDESVGEKLVGRF